MEEKWIEKAQQFVEMDEESPKQFVDYMSTSRKDLSWKWPTAKWVLWVFWTEDKASNHTSTKSDDHISIQDRIKTALSSSVMDPSDDDALVQFWAATTTMTDEGARHVLTTADQPFALNCLTNEKLNRYKKNCPNYKYVDQGEEEHNLTDGSIGRVFRRQWPEMSADISCYSVKEYPERDLALGCGFNSTFNFPLFEPSLDGCVGVLELLFTKYPSFHISWFVEGVIRALQDAGLRTIDPWKSPYVKSSLAMEELEVATTKVCKIHGLILGNIWSRCEQISSVDSSSSYGVNCRGELLISTPCFVSTKYALICWFAPPQKYKIPQRVGHSLLGKVFSSDKPSFCRDVTQLSIIDYHMAHLAREAGLKSCFFACLQTVATGNRDIALEFFLPQDKIQSADLHNFLSSILTTLKHHLKGFEVVTGDIRNDFFTEIGNLTGSNVEASMVKGKNVIIPEQGDTSFTHNTLNTQTDYKLASALNKPSGHRTVPSVPPPSLASTYNQISILTSQVQYMQADIAQFQKLIDEYKASSCQSMEL